MPRQAPVLGAPDLESLWRTFRKNPSDLAFRAVLADALQLVGDPRGEYLAHALAGKPSKLLAKHIDAWTGKLGGIKASTRRFEGGFLHAVCVEGEPGAFERSIDEPEWCTLDELHVGRTMPTHIDGDRALAAFLRTPHAPRSLVIPEYKIDSLVEKLAKRGRFPRVEVIGSSSWIPEKKLAVFPSLRIVGTRARRTGMHEALERGAWLDAIVSIEATLAPADIHAFDAGRVPELRVTIGKTMNDWTADGYGGWGIRLRKGDPHADIRFGTGRFAPGSLAELLEALRPKRRSFSIRLPSSGPARLKAKAEIPPRLDVRFVDTPLDLWAPNL